MNHFFHSTTIASLLLLAATAGHSAAEIIVETVSRERAKELGLTMKSRKNGDAGVMVWLEFKKEGFLEAFTYAELHIEDPEGEHRLSAMLRPNPVVHGQPDDLVSVSFSAQPDQLEKCSFLVVAYGSNQGDVGYYLRVKDFIELKKGPQGEGVQADP